MYPVAGKLQIASPLHLPPGLQITRRETRMLANDGTAASQSQISSLIGIISIAESQCGALETVAVELREVHGAARMQCIGEKWGEMGRNGRSTARLSKFAVAPVKVTGRSDSRPSLTFQARPSESLSKSEASMAFPFS